MNSWYKLRGEYEILVGFVKIVLIMKLCTKTMLGLELISSYSYYREINRLYYT